MYQIITKTNQVEPKFTQAYFFYENMIKMAS